MEVSWSHTGIALLVFLALAGVALIILASGNRKS